MKLLSYAPILAALWVTSVASNAAPSKHDVSPSAADRIKFPNRLWHADHPSVPNEPGKWVFTNDLGASAPYWYKKNITESPIPVPNSPKGTTSSWSDAPESGLTSRVLPTYINMYWDNYCTPSTFVGQVANPTPGQCYGQATGANSALTLFFPGPLSVKDYVNVYSDDSCRRFMYQVTNYYGSCFGAGSWFRSIFTCSFC